MSSSSAPWSTPEDPGDVMLASRLTVVRDEIEAETICGLLRTEGIACNQRQTDMGAGAWEATGSGGPREILVASSDLERARELIKPDTSTYGAYKRSQAVEPSSVDLQPTNARTESTALQGWEDEGGATP